MLRKLTYSPYAPRPRRSGRLVLLWMAVLAFIIYVTYYLNTRQRAATMSAAEPLAEEILRHDRVAGDALRNKIRPPKGPSRRRAVEWE
ncbi:hypothetical protein PG994_001883 [Apiospora phragmitis]|uniref:Uncharacterized protein n=1 Tax=Apiospora phragmitis TaxID=2905665 RepID=A0ABR1WUT9_9PEZI